MSVCDNALLAVDHVWSSKECVYGASDPNERTLSAPSVNCVQSAFLYVGKVISSFRRLRVVVTGSLHVRMLFL